MRFKIGSTYTLGYGIGKVKIESPTAKGKTFKAVRESDGKSIHFGDPDMPTRQDNPKAKKAYCDRAGGLAPKGFNPNTFSLIYWDCIPANPAKNSIETNVIKYEDGKYFVYSEEGKKLSKGYADKAEAEKRLGQIEYHKSMNKILLQTNVRKSMISQEGAYFRIKGIPITVNNAVMNGVLYPQDENEKGMNSMVNKPLTIDHPVDENGNFISGREGKGLQKHYSGGIITNTYEMGDKWYADAEIESEVLKVKSPLLYERLNNKEDLPVSTGLLFTQNEQSGTNAKGQKYNKVAINQSYDHLAALTNETPAGGDDTVARFNSENLTIVNVEDFMANEDEEVKSIINAFKSAPKAVKEFFSSILHNDQTNGYNKQESNINVNEEIMDREQLLQLFGLNADSSISDDELNTMAQNTMKEGMKAKAKKMSDMDDEDEEENMDMKKKKNMYKKNSSDNPELEALQAQVNSMAKQLEQAQNAEKEGLAVRLANSDCGLDKEDLMDMSVNALKKLEAKHLGVVGANYSFDHTVNSGKHELDDMGAPE